MFLLPLDNAPIMSRRVQFWVGSGWQCLPLLQRHLKGWGGDRAEMQCRDSFPFIYSGKMVLGGRYGKRFTSPVIADCGFERDALLKKMCQPGFQNERTTSFKIDILAAFLVTLGKLIKRA